jgi:hypothetical protein
MANQRCFVLRMNRGRGRLIKKAKYTADIISVSTGFFQHEDYVLPDEVKPIELDLSSATNKLKTVPLFIVSDLTHHAVSTEVKEANIKGEAINLYMGIKMATKMKDGVEISLPDTDTKLNLLMKGSFWRNFGKTLKLTPFQMLIYLAAGAGFALFVERVITIIFLRQP